MSRRFTGDLSAVRDTFRPVIAADCLIVTSQLADTAASIAVIITEMVARSSYSADEVESRLLKSEHLVVSRVAGRLCFPT